MCLRHEFHICVNHNTNGDVSTAGEFVLYIYFFFAAVFKCIFCVLNFQSAKLANVCKQNIVEKKAYYKRLVLVFLAMT